MLLHFNIPLYRFFSKESQVESMLNEGLVYFNTIKAFNTLDDPRYKDIDEGGHAFKQDTSKGWTSTGSNDGPKLISSVTIRKRRIPDAWAFCGTCSTVSKAKKQHAIRINHTMDFIRQLDYSLEQKFGTKLPIFFGPISYYNLETDRFSPHEQPPYFSKLDKYKDDLEFRIVIIPPENIKDLKPEIFKLPEPNKIFSKTLIL
jgi:hypothetical protein